MTADSPAVVASFTPQLEQAREAFLSAGQVEGQSTPREEQVVVPYPLLGLAEVLRFPPLKWIVKDLIPDIGIGQFWGASTSGKSFLTLDLVLRPRN